MLVTNLVVFPGQEQLSRDELMSLFAQPVIILAETAEFVRSDQVLVMAALAAKFDDLKPVEGSFTATELESLPTGLIFHWLQRQLRRWRELNAMERELKDLEEKEEEKEKEEDPAYETVQSSEEGSPTKKRPKPKAKARAMRSAMKTAPKAKAKKVKTKKS